MTSLYEIYYREMYRERLAEADAARAIKQALKHTHEADQQPSQNITAVLQKYRMKLVRVYHNLYQRNKSLRAVRN